MIIQTLINKFKLDEPKTDAEVKEIGLRSAELRNNKAFIEAINTLHSNYVYFEDNVTMANDDNANENRLFYSQMRLVLNDFIDELDGQIQAGSNAVYHLEEDDK